MFYKVTRGKNEWNFGTYTEAKKKYNRLTASEEFTRLYCCGMFEHDIQLIHVKGTRIRET